MHKKQDPLHQVTNLSCQSTLMTQSIYLEIDFFFFFQFNMASAASQGRGFF